MWRSISEAFLDATFVAYIRLFQNVVKGSRGARSVIKLFSHPESFDSYDFHVVGCFYRAVV